MAIKHYKKRAFLREIYTAAPASEAARHAYLDAKQATAIAAQRSGRILTGTSFGGTSASYAVRGEHTSENDLEEIDWARDYIAADTIDDALALVPPMVRSFQIRTTNLHVNG